MNRIEFALNFDNYTVTNEELIPPYVRMSMLCMRLAKPPLLSS